MDKALLEAALIAVKDCLKVQKGETVLVVTDSELREIGEAILEAAKGLEAEAMLMEIIPRERNGEEPPDAVTAAMMKSDVVVAPTSKSLTHTGARRKACAEGSRVATMPGILRETMIRCLNADYYAISDRTKRLRWSMVAPFCGAARKQQIQRPLGKTQIWGKAQL